LTYLRDIIDNTLIAMKNENASVDYDEVSRIYDTSRVAHAEVIEKLVRLMHVGHDSMALDMGCGTGNYTAAIQQAINSIIGIDLSRGMLNQARAKFPSLPLIYGDITSLPFDSDIFDGAYAVQVLHHVRKKEIFLKEARRVLKKGAYLALDSCSHQQMRTFWLYHYFPQGIEVDLARIPDVEDIANLLEATGFSNVAIEISYSDVAFEHEKPERYLDRDFRNGQSTFCLLSDVDIEAGCKRLREDIASGAVEVILKESEAKEALAGGSCIICGRK
jgi:ubiquinone/menaquinone biosynthesis C-methylase UbiE